MNRHFGTRALVCVVCLVPIIMLMRSRILLDSKSPRDEVPPLVLESYSIRVDDTKGLRLLYRTSEDQTTPTVRRWDTIRYSALLRNVSSATLTNVRVTIEPSQDIISLFGRDPFPRGQLNDGSYGAYDDPRDLEAGQTLKVGRWFRTHENSNGAFPTLAKDLTDNEWEHFVAVKESVTLNITWDGGAQSFVNPVPTE